MTTEQLAKEKCKSCQGTGKEIYWAEPGHTFVTQQELKTRPDHKDCKGTGLHRPGLSERCKWIDDPGYTISGIEIRHHERCTECGEPETGNNPTNRVPKQDANMIVALMEELPARWKVYKLVLGGYTVDDAEDKFVGRGDTAQEALTEAVSLNGRR